MMVKVKKRILIVGAIVLLLLVAYGKQGEAPPPQPESEVPHSLTAAELIGRCTEKISALNYFHFDLDQLGGGIPIGMGLRMTNASGDVSRPDKLKLTMEAARGDDAVEVSVITVGETTYMTNPLTGEWEPLSSEFTALKLFDPDVGMKAVLGGITDVKLGMITEGGGLALKGIECDVVSHLIRGAVNSNDLMAITAGTAIEGVPTDTVVWIGKDDFLLRRIVLRGTIIQDEELGAVRILPRVLCLSNFDQPVTIELPE